MFRKVLHHLLRVADATGTKLRQSHRDLAKSAFLMHGRYMSPEQERRATLPKAKSRGRGPWMGRVKAKQFRRARKERKKLKTYAGRVHRDLERKISLEDFKLHRGTMMLAELVLTQEKHTKGKIYSMHAPEVECIAKGKAHKPYEFGVSPEQERRTTFAQRGPAGWRT